MRKPEFEWTFKPVVREFEWTFKPVVREFEWA